jgi:hypothetical protein
MKRQLIDTPLSRRLAGGSAIRCALHANVVPLALYGAGKPPDHIHPCIETVARFDADRRDPDYKPTQTPHFIFDSSHVY